MPIENMRLQLWDLRQVLAPGAQDVENNYYYISIVSNK